MIKTIFASNEPKISNYIETTFSPEDSTLQEIRNLAETNGLPSIQVGKMDSLHLEVITRATGALKVVEIGTLGGYSGLSLLRGTGKKGKLYTFELDPLNAKVAQKAFQMAGVLDQVEVYVGPALENLNRIQDQGPFDLVFIDADKVNYPKYLDWAYQNLKKGGVVLGDNTLAWGMIADEKFDSEEDKQATLALREYNKKIATSGLFRGTILPTGEGLTIGVKV